MPFFFIFLRAACRRAVLPTPYSPSRATEFIHNPSIRILKKYFKKKLCLTMLGPWNNGKEVPRGGDAELQKMSPPTTGRCYSLMRSQLTNHQLGIILDVQVRLEKLQGGPKNQKKCVLKKRKSAMVGVF